MPKGWSYYTWKCLAFCSGPQRQLIAKLGMQLGVQSIELHFSSLVRFLTSSLSQALEGLTKCLVGIDETTRQGGASPWF